MYYVGIDPGMTGGIACIHNGGLELFVMPVIKREGKAELDIPALITLFRRWAAMPDGEVFCVIEKAQVMPEGDGKNRCPICKRPMWGKGGPANRRQGAAGIGNYMRNYGVLLGILATTGVSYQEVHPRTWTSALLKRKDMPTKLKGELEALKLFPGVSFLATPRCSKRHQGLIDAALVAYWARMNH